MSADLWNRPPPPGFVGLREEQVTAYRRHLPHWRQPNATYFVTFRLADSLPAFRLRELEDLRRRIAHLSPDRRVREVQERVERWLDLGYGACPLRSDPCRGIVRDALLHFAGERYELGCFVVMPNHVHVLVRPFENVGQASRLSGQAGRLPHNSKTPLARVLHTWKSYTSHKICELSGRDGQLWQHESYDRIVRDEEHLWRVIHYIGANPGKANISAEGRVWFSPEWEAIGWGWNP